MFAFYIPANTSFFVRCVNLESVCFFSFFIACKLNGVARSSTFLCVQNLCAYTETVFFFRVALVVVVLLFFLTFEQRTFDAIFHAFCLAA